jgi:hypothetical protein
MAKKKHAHIEQQKETRKLSVLAESVLELTNGEQIEVMRHDGAYYYCKGRKFRISHPNIAKVLSASEWQSAQHGEIDETKDAGSVESDIAYDTGASEAYVLESVIGIYADELDSVSDAEGSAQDNEQDELPFTDVVAGDE